MLPSTLLRRALAALAALSSCAPVLAQPAVELAERLRAAPRPHPRLFLDEKAGAALRQSLASRPVQKQTLDFVRRTADRILAARPVERRKVGRRLLRVSRTCLKRVVYLAFAFRMTGVRRYATRAEQEMLAAAAFEDWNPSHFLDVAEMTAALAIGYDWLHAELSADGRAAIRQAILDKGLRTSLRGGWWVQTTNNWNQVCHGGLSLGALVVLETDAALAEKILRRAIVHLPRAMHEYAPDGGYPEGPGYWNYGTTYNVVLLDALRTALGTDFGLAGAPGFAASADYHLHTTGPTGLYFNYSDCGKRGGIVAATNWFAARRKDPALLWNERRELAAFLKTGKPDAGPANGWLPFTMIWAGGGDDSAPPRALHYVARGRTPIATHRTGWNERASFVAIKGGSPGTNHAHMDIGSFVMDAAGVRWATDLGSQSYHSLESKGLRLWGRDQKSQRWTVFRLNSLSHNVLVVDGRHQRVQGSAPIVSHVATGTTPHTIVDLGAAYEGQLARARRGVALRKDGSVLVQDEFQTLGRRAQVRWGMVTRAEVQSLQGDRVVLSRGKEELTLRVASPFPVRWQVFDTAEPKAAHDAANPGTRMVGFVATIGPKAAVTWVVSLTPGRAPDAPPAVRPLRRW